MCQRGWKADAFLQDIFDTFVYGKNCLTAIIEFSVEFKAKFEKETKQLDEGEVTGSVRSLSMARHRHNVTQKPLGRNILYLDCMINVASYILQTRRSNAKEGKAATQYLEKLNPETVLQAAMLADAGEECDNLLRYFDSDDADITFAGNEIEGFIRRVKYLFDRGQRGCLATTSYTSVALSALRRVRIFQVNKSLKSLGCPGGVPSTVIDKCFDRMHCWVVVALEILTAECPGWDLLYAHSVFNLVKKKGTARTAENDDEEKVSERRAHFERLALSCSVDVDKLQAQHAAHAHAAEMHFVTSSGSSLDSWIATVQRTRKRKYEKYASDALHTVLAHTSAYRMCTTVLEHAFSKKCKTITAQASCLSMEAERDILQVRLDREMHEDAAIVARARALWAERYGAPRKSPAEKRLDYGLKRPRENTEKTETAWLRKRRCAVDDAANTSRKPLGNFTAEGQGDTSGWTPGHDKEIKFQREKLGRREVEAFEDNLLLKEEITDELKTRVTTTCKERTKKDREGKRKHEKALLADSGGRPMSKHDLDGKKIFIPPDFQNDVDVMKGAFDLGLDETSERSKAHVFVCSDPSTPGNRMELPAVFVGGPCLAILRCVSCNGMATCT